MDANWKRAVMNKGNKNMEKKEREIVVARKKGGERKSFY